jgi:hypothetical protein
MSIDAATVPACDGQPAFAVRYAQAEPWEALEYVERRCDRGPDAAAMLALAEGRVCWWDRPERLSAEALRRLPPATLARLAALVCGPECGPLLFLCGCVELGQRACAVFERVGRGEAAPGEFGAAARLFTAAATAFMEFATARVLKGGRG